MTALEHLNMAGLTVEVVAGRLRAYPAERLTPEIRAFISSNKSTLLSELEAAQRIDRDRLRANVQQLAELLNMTPRELLACGVIEPPDYPQLARMTPDVVRVLARVSSERLAK